MCGGSDLPSLLQLQLPGVELQHDEAGQPGGGRVGGGQQELQGGEGGAGGVAAVVGRGGRHQHSVHHRPALLVRAQHQVRHRLRQEQTPAWSQ